jgi:hypothetical protein
MAPDTLSELLKLPPGDRAELAMALWASLDDASAALASEQRRDDVGRGPSGQTLHGS